MGERRGTKALELWCRRITDGYPGVNVQNMTTSWRDGLAFCAMIHHFRPDLVDFNGLNKDDVYGNNELAFRTAEQHLGIPALLDAEDMASCAVPDRLSILTYLSQFYQTFGGLSPSRPAMKRAKEESDERLASVSSSPQPKVGVRLGVRKEPCVVCGLPVFLAEKLVISRSLYHRTCFRCARCNNQLTLGNYYETEEGQYCCETCPDEELPAAPVMHQDYNQTALFGGRGGAAEELEYQQPASTAYKRALSDEEKTSKRSGKPISNSNTIDGRDSSFSEVAKIRLNFMTNHLLAGNQQDDVKHTAVKESPHPADKGNKTPDESDHTEARSSPTLHAKTDTVPSLPISPSPQSSIGSQEFGSSSESCVNATRMSGTDDESSSGVDSGQSASKLRPSFVSNQHVTASATHDVDNKSLTKFNDDTKDSVAVRGRKDVEASGQRLSLVQQRLKIFESSIQAEEGKERVKEPNSVVNIVKNSSSGVIEKKEEEDGNVEAQKKEQEEVEKEEKVAKESCLDLSGDLDSVRSEEDSTQNSSGNIEVECESTKALELPEDKPLSAAVILQKMIDSREPRLDTSGAETSLSNLSGVDLGAPGSGEYPEDLNPFQSDDDGDICEEDKLRQTAVNNKSEKYVSTNPFGSSDEDEAQDTTPPRPAARKNHSIVNKNKDSSQPPARRLIQAPQMTLNPFWSDEEDCESEEEKGANTGSKSTPVPKPRTLKPTPEPSPVPRKTSLARGGLYASNSSIGSTGSMITPGGTYRKKKPAPPPPSAQEMFSPTSTFDTIEKSPDDSQSSKVAPARTPRIRKMKPAPPPPMSTSTPQSMTDSLSAEANVTEISHSMLWDDQKNSKDETNRNRQSLSAMPCNDESSHQYSVPFVDKSAQGKWKRKKGPAPPRPIPHKRKIKVMSVKDVKLELDEIELQQQGLEKQGVRLEQLIRDKCETGQENEECTSLRVDVEELVLELFALVNEKNELFRRQAELMLLRRQQRLEKEHADVEYQIRCLMSQPEATKTDSDKQHEEVLIQRLVEIVERRNEIVECLEMDRRREVEEDRSINEQMGLFAAKSKADLNGGSDNFHSSPIPRKEKSKEKHKEKKVKKSHKKDADKDVDETEMKLKRHKKKWF